MVTAPLEALAPVEAGAALVALAAVGDGPPVGAGVAVVELSTTDSGADPATVVATVEPVVTGRPPDEHAAATRLRNPSHAARRRAFRGRRALAPMFGPARTVRADDRMEIGAGGRARCCSFPVSAG